MEMDARSQGVAGVWPPQNGRRPARQSQTRTGCATSARRPALSAALRYSLPWPRRQLTSRTAFAAFRQSRRSQITKRAARAGHGRCVPRRLAGASRAVRVRLCGSARGVCSANHPRPDFVSGATRQGRFLVSQHEPLAGGAWHDALTVVCVGGRKRTAAKHRQKSPDPCARTRIGLKHRTGRGARYSLRFALGRAIAAFAYTRPIRNEPEAGS